MTNNDVLRSLRFILNVHDADLIDIIGLAGGGVSPAEMDAYLKTEAEPGYVECPHAVMAQFLNGVVIHRRGRDETRPTPPLEVPVTNNVVLKKVRIAFELRDTDLIRLIEKPGVLKVSKSELGAFFRAPTHRNYRECGDQYLRNLFKGLA